MLIYARKEDSHDPVPSTQSLPLPFMTTVKGVVPVSGLIMTTPTPPPRALEVVDALNAAHDEACDVFAAKWASYTQFLMTNLIIFPQRKRDETSFRRRTTESNGYLSFLEHDGR